MTRLRLRLQDDATADLDQIKKIDGVLGAVFGGGQLQVVLGPNVTAVYAELARSHPGVSGYGAPSTTGPKEKQNWTPKRVSMGVLNFIAGSVTPMITALVAGGMLKVILLLVTLPWPSLQATRTFEILTALSNVPFYFMPILIAYGASKQLGCRPIYPIIVASLLISPVFVGLVASGERLDLFGVPVYGATYSRTMIPALLSTIAVYWAEKLFEKIIPGIAKTILVGTLTITTAGFLALTVLGPIGAIIGQGLVGMFSALEATVGPFAVGILATLFVFMIMFGIHTITAPLMVQNLSGLGYDAFVRPAMLMHTLAEGGAALGVAFRLKDKALKAQAFSIAGTAIIAGVTEPAIYGIALRYKRPLIGVLAGAFAGGITAGLLGARAFSAGRNTILALPIFEGTIVAAAIGCVVALVVAGVIAFILGVDEGAAAVKESAEEAREDALLFVSEPTLVAVVDGTAIPLEQVKDEVFSMGTMGNGTAITPTGTTVVSPTTGTLTAVFPGGHAYGITRPDGVEVLVHIGIDTVKLKGRGFSLKVAQGDHVTAGQPLVELDRKALDAANADLTTLVIITDDKGKDIGFVTDGPVTAGQTTIADITPAHTPVP